MSQHSEVMPPTAMERTGVNGRKESKVEADGNRPRTPSFQSLSLTEYTANPSPPSSTPKNKLKGVVPDEFLLPSGYPDVITRRLVQLSLIDPITVSTTHPYLTSLRSSTRNTSHARHESQ